MKNLNFLWLAAAACLLGFTSCDKNDNTPDPVMISFEAATLPAEGYLNNAAYTKEQGVSFSNTYNTTYGTWSGFSISKLTDKTTVGYGNQYSVYADGGAAGSKQFAVCYYSAYDATPAISFGVGNECDLVSVAVNNGTYAYLSMHDGDAYAKKFEAGDWFKMTLSAFDADRAAAGTVDFYLADFRDGKTYLCDRWTTLDLSSLEDVNRVEITFSSSDNGSWGMNTPAYVCLDNLIFYPDVTIEDVAE